MVRPVASLAVILLLSLLLTPSSLLRAGPTIHTTEIIALPTGLDVSHLDAAELDKDNDGLVDAAEDEIAEQITPIYRFDSGEPALRAFEPVLLHAVYPFQWTVDGRLIIRVKFAELYADDGGFVYCNFPEPNGCNDHIGDSQSRTFDLVVTSVRSAVFNDPVPDVDTGAPLGFDDTHPILYPSWGKHHVYYSPYYCPGHELNSCDCEESCGLGHWDRADGGGVERRPVSYNVGQDQVFDFCSKPTLSPGGFVNNLASLGYPNEFVFDPCDCTDDECDGNWRAFFGDDSDITSVHNIVFEDPILPDLIYLTDEEGVCNYSAFPSMELDPDGDDIPWKCDSCPLTHAPHGQHFPFLFDIDADGFASFCDNCPVHNNPEQEDFDGDSLGDPCDNCPYFSNADQRDTDYDEVGDVCDLDDDNDGCSDRVDQHPKESNVAIGAYRGNDCAGEITGYEGDDSDGDGVINCMDTDDDNDGIPDDEDSCPAGDWSPLGGCTLIVVDCRPFFWAETCVLGGCFNFFLKVYSVINPDPTHETVFDRFQIVNQQLFLDPLPGMSIAESAQAFVSPGADGGGSGTEPELLRLEIWARGNPLVPEQAVAVVAEFYPHEVSFGPLGPASFLFVDPGGGSPDVPCLLDSTWAVGATPGTQHPDMDEDGYPDFADNCRMVANSDQNDTDGDGIGDACDEPPALLFVRGDCDNDGFVGGSVSDPLFYLNWAFQGGPEPECLAACDADSNGFVGGSVNDAVYYLNWAFVGGPAPGDPFPQCGPGTTVDATMGCETVSPACQ